MNLQNTIYIENSYKIILIWNTLEGCRTLWKILIMNLQHTIYIESSYKIILIWNTLEGCRTALSTNLTRMTATWYWEALIEKMQVYATLARVLHCFDCCICLLRDLPNIQWVAPLPCSILMGLTQSQKTP
jgi:hypothetical protein